MFQTEPIIYLQSLGNEWFTFLMILITKMGSSFFLVAVVVAISFGIDFKRGFLLYQLLLWTGMTTEILKVLIAFPRPDFVDSRVFNLESGIKNTSPFNGNGSKGIFELPDKQIVKAFRLQEVFNLSAFGFPSAHVSLTTAVLGGSATIFNRRNLKIMTPLMVVVMAFSRVYLGRHFIGDVFGGAILGLIFLIAFAHFIKSPLKEELFKKESFKIAFRSPNLIFYFFMFAIPLFFAAHSLISADIAGIFLGTNFAYLLIVSKGFPNDTAGTSQRVTRVLIALFLFGISSLIFGVGFEVTGMTNYLNFTLLGFLKTFFPASTIWLSMEICKMLDLYTKNENA
jgi:membrane-associated phospholipid phosphatase